MDALSIGLLIAGLVIGFLLAYLICGSRSRRVAADLEGRLQAAQRQVTDRDRQIAAAASQSQEQQRSFATLTDDQTGLQERLTATGAQLDDANRAAADLADRLNAAVAERLGVDADLEQARADAVGLQATIASLHEQIAGLEAERAADAESFRGLAAEFEARGGELDSLTGELNALKAKYARERLDMTLRPYLNSARARELADPQANLLEQPAMTGAETANVEQMRAALLDMAAAKISVDDDLRTREVDLIEANGRVSALRTSVDTLTAAGAELAGLLGFVKPAARTVQADAVQADAVAEVGAALEELKAAVAAREAELADAGHALDRMVTAAAARDEELADAGRALDSMVTTVATRDEELAALRANLDALAAEKGGIEEELAGRRAAFDGIKQRVAAALAALQTLGATGAPASGAADVPADEPVFEDMSGGDAEPGAEERFTAEDGPDWDEPGSTDELEELGRIDGTEPLAEGEAEYAADLAADSAGEEAGLAPELPELDELDAAIVAAAAAFRGKGEAVTALEADLNDLQSILTDTQAARTQLEEELSRRRAAFAALQERLGGLAGELEAVAEPGAGPAAAAPEGALEGAAAEEVAPELPESVWEEPHAEPGQILEEAAGVAAVAPDAEAVEPFSGEEESAARFVADSMTDIESEAGEADDDGQHIAARLAAGVAGVLGALRARDGSIEALRTNVAEAEAARAGLDEQVQANAGELESLTAAKAELDTQVAAREGELGEIERRVGAWLGSLRELLAGDPDALALLDAPQAEDAAEEPAAGIVEAVEAVEAVEPAEVTEPAETVETAETAETVEPAVPNRVAAIAASLSAGAAAIAAALGKKETQLGAVQGELDATLAEGDALQAQIADAQTRFAGVRSEIAGWYGSLQADYAADPDVAAALGLAPVPEAAFAEQPEPGLAFEDEEEQTAAEAPVAEDEADPVALLKAGIAAVGVLLGKRSAELEEVRSGVVDLSAQEESLRGELGAQAASLTGLSERIAAWTLDLRAQFADDPDVLAALDRAQAPAPMPQPVAADEATAAEAVAEMGEVEAAAGAPAPGPVALLSAGIAAVGVALGKRSAELDEVRSGVVNLTAEQETLRGELDGRAAALNGLSERIAAWVADLRTQYADDPDVLAALDAAQLQVESAPEAAEPGAPVQEITPFEEEAGAAVEAPAPEPLALLTAGIGAVGVVVAKKDGVLAEVQSRLDGVLVSQAEAEQVLQREHAELETLNAGVAAWFTELQGRMAGDEELAALLQPAGDGSPAEGEEAVQPSAAALLVTGRAATAAAFDKHDNLIAYLESDLSGVQQLKAQGDEQLADLNERAANLQAQLDAAAAEKLQLEQELADANAELDRLLDEVGTAADGLRVAFNLPPEEAAPAGEEAVLGAETPMAEEMDPVALRRRKLARIGVLTAGVTSATAAFQQRNTELEGAQAKVTDLETQVADAATRVQAIELEAQSTVPLAEHEQALAGVQAQLDGAVAERDRVQAELDDLNVKIADARAQIEAAIGDDEDLRTFFTNALQAQEAPEAGAEEEMEGGALRKAAGIGALTAGMAGVVNAAHKRAEDVQQAQVRVAELEAAEVSLGEKDAALAAVQAQAGDLQAQLDAAVQAREQALAEAQAQAADLQSQFDAAVAERDRVQAELDDLNVKIADARAQIEAAIGEDEELRAVFAAALQGQQAEGEGEGSEEAGTAGRVAGIGLLTAGMAGVVAAAHRRSGDVQQAQTRLVELESQGAALGDEQTRLAAELQAGEQLLAEAQAQLAAVQGERDATAAQLNGLNERLAALQGELEATAASRSALEAQLQAREADLAEISDGVQSWLGQLKQEFAGDAELEALLAQADAGTLEAQTRTGEVGEGAAPRRETPPVAGLIALGGAAALGGYQRRNDALRDANSQMSGLQERLASLDAERSRLEAALAEREQVLAGSQTQVGELQSTVQTIQAQLAQTNEQLASVQADLESTQAARTQAEEALRQSEAEMDQMVGKLSGLGEQLRAGFGDEADFAAAEAAEAERSGAGRMARLGVLSAGVGAALNRTRKQGDALQSSQTQVEKLTADLTAARSAEQKAAAQLQQSEQAARNAQGENAALQTSLSERSGEIAVLEREQETLTRRVRDLERQLSVAEERAQAAEQAAQESAEQARRARLAGGAGVAAGGVAAAGTVRRRRQGSEGGEQETEAEAAGEVSAEEAEAAAEVGGQRLEAAVPLDIPAEGEEAAGGDVNAELADLQEQLATAQARLAEVNQQLAFTDEERSALEAAIAQRETETTQYRTRLADLVGSVVDDPSQANWTRLSGVKASAARGAFLAGTKPVFSGQLQDLTLVAGIGQVLEQRLFEAGIGTYWEVATMSDEDFARILHTANLPVQRFTPAEIRASASRLAEATNTVGHIWEERPIDDFDPLPGIGRVFEKRLYAAGIFTFEDLAAATVERLEEVCKAPKTRIPNYAAWIEVAKTRLPEQLAQTAAEEPASEAPEEPPAADEGESA